MTPTSSTKEFNLSANSNWGIYNDGAAAIPVNGAGTAAGSISVPTVNVTNPLSGTQDLVFTKTAANSQGQGWAWNFTVDKGFLGGPVYLSFNLLSSANYASGDVVCYVYDVTNSQLITPVSVSVPNSMATSPTQFYSAFNPNTTSNSYRLILHIATVNALAWTLEVDNISVYNQQKLVGAAIGNWIAYTPTLTNAPNITSNIGLYRRVGDSVEIDVAITFNGAITGVFEVALPAGLSMDTAKLAAIATNQSTLGYGQCLDTSASTYYSVYTTYGSDATKFQFLYLPTNVILATVPFTWAATDKFRFNAKVPISGWSSNINLITDFTEYVSNSKGDNTATDTTSFAYGSGGSLIPNGAVGTTYSRRIRFTKPFQITDKIILEIAYPTAGDWRSLTDRFPFVELNGKKYGCEISRVNGTDYDVTFATGGSTPGTAATYGADGWAWSSLAAFYWRVRKVSNGNMAEATLASAQIGPSTSYVLTASNTQGFGTPTGQDIRYRRVGDKLEVWGYVNVGTVTAAEARVYLPLGLTTPAIGYSQICGRWWSDKTSANGWKSGDVRAEVSQSYVTFTVADYANTAGPFASQLASTICPSSVTFSLMFSVPIAQWGSNINLVSDFTEYAWNSSVTTGGDTTSFGYGSSGMLIQNFAPAANSNVAKRVRFTRPIQQTDSIVVEIDYASSGVWINAGTLFPNQQNDAGTTYYGINFARVAGSLTDVDVRFFYMADKIAGETWTAYNTSKWRVRKVSNGNMAEAVYYDGQIGNWTSYTPTVTGLGSKGIVTNTCTYRRVGSSVEIQGYILTDAVAAGAGSTTISVSLPSGLSVDVSNNTVAYGMYNDYSILNASQFGPGQWVIYNDATSFRFAKYATGTVLTTAEANVARTISLSFRAMIPISQWTSNINLAADFTEYVSNSGATGAGLNDTTNFVYGNSGSLTQTYSAKVTRQVHFTRPINVNDKLFIEVSTDGVIWSDISTPFVSATSTVVPYQEQNSVSYGIGQITKISSTDVNVTFGLYRAPTGATYGAAGATWNAATTDGLRWRVRKVSNGNFAETTPPSLVRAEYRNNVNPTAGAGVAVWSTKVEDTHNIVTSNGTTTFSVTIPIAGVYQISATGYCPAQGTYASVRKATVTITSSIGGASPFAGARWQMISRSFRFAVGDVIDIYCSAAISSDTNHAFTIERIGS